VHSAAQSIITLVRLGDLHPESARLAHDVCRWTLDNLLDCAGWFVYQKTAWFTTRIPYMRWAQMWMLLALSDLLVATEAANTSKLSVKIEQLAKG
jgi:hypothetical protein